MLVDDNSSVRRDAVQKIIVARNEQRSSNVRVFKKLKRHNIHEDATVYYEVLLWHTLTGKIKL